MNLLQCEAELKKRLIHPYVWERMQNDQFDRQTRFIYRISRFDELLDKIKREFNGRNNYNSYFNYALNRWYNFWSAQAVEQVFCSNDLVIPARNSRDRTIDFTISGIPFDHKTSVFPRQFGHDLVYAQSNLRDLIKWLYFNQSQQQRMHMKNRLFLVLHSSDGEHWKLKAEISWLKTVIEEYLVTFDSSKLHRFSFDSKDEVLSDVIWVINP